MMGGTQEDDPSWQEVTAQVTKLPAVKTIAPEPPKRLRRKKVSPAPVLSDALSSQFVPRALPPSLLAKLGSGRVKAQARLDLHGLTLAEAYPALIGFLTQCHAAGLEMVMVITGKGPDSTGALKREFPLWCEIPPCAGWIRSLSLAHPKDGGEGAFYLQLTKGTPA